jgi:hypothetical protein
METKNKRGGLKTYQAFTPPSPYEMERRKAEQQRRYAELLQEQAMAEDEPYTYQGIRAMPSPAAALGKLLKAYGAKKASEKADEAEARKAGMEQQASQQIMGRLFGGAPMSMADTTPDESGLAEVAVQSQYRVAPEDAARLSMAPVGAAATRGNPMLAARLAQALEKPEAEEFYAPTKTADGLVQFGKRGGVRKTGVEAPAETEVGMTEYQRKMLGLRERDVSLRERATGVNRPMSATAQRELFDADENVLATQSGIEMLDQAIKLSPVAYEGIGASERAKTATILPDRFEPAGTKETLEFDLLLKQQVLPQLKSIFGSAPTEGERAILLELQGSSSLPKATRENLLKRARNMANQRLQFNKQKAQKLREGSYFMEQPTVMPPDGFDLE